MANRTSGRDSDEALGAPSPTAAATTETPPSNELPVGVSLLVLTSPDCTECAGAVGDAFAIARALGGLQVDVVDSAADSDAHTQHSPPLLPTVVMLSDGHTLGYLVGRMPVDLARARVALKLGFPTPT